MQNKQKYRVNIDGENYTIVGKYSPEHIENVVAIVNQQLSQLAELDASLSVKDRAILMAVNAISDQVVKEQKIMTLEEKIDQLKFEQTSLFNQ